MQNAREKAISKPRIFYGWYLVAASWAMTFLLGATSVGIFFKPMLDEFGWDRATLSLVSSVIMLIFAALYPLLGRLIDRLGPRIMISVCIGSQIISNVINGLAANLLQIYIGRLFWELKPVHGVQVLINRWFVKNRGRALGILSTGTPLGTLLMTPLSQYLITIWGWRETLFFWAGISALVFIPLTFMIRNKPEDKG
ncbi:MAG: MFS transporter, partial [Dehalococcoidales bacterium]|nr:MFS transporter [Dehalococcoidales bacterium]